VLFDRPSQLGLVEEARLDPSTDGPGTRTLASSRLTTGSHISWSTLRLHGRQSFDGRTFTIAPDTVAVDPITDLAILRIDAEDLPAAVIGDSATLRVGDWLVDIGNPMGLGISAKEGIASRLDVSIVAEGQTRDGLIETSAAINPGNSGGPLVNMKGEVIGITSTKVASVGIEGLGYAISINEAMLIIEGLIRSK